MKKLLLNNTGHHALIDDDDYDKITSFGVWYESDTGYALKRGYIQGKSSTIRMHRVIMDAPKGVEVDHINGNKLDNRKNNLRVVSHAINSWNVIQNKKRKYDKGLPVGIAWDNTRGLYIATKILRSRFKSLDDALSFQRESELYEHEHRRIKPNLPTGVFQNKSNRGYQAKITINGERYYLGTFPTIEGAENAYLERKRG